ncbi:MAG: glycosyltransferase family 1 protein, partial [Pseudomonadota bacterium]
MSTAPDILMVADPRFAGGTSSALIADVEAFVAAGASVGLMPVRSAFLDDMGEAWHPGVRALLDHATVREIAPGAVTAGTAFLHHPAIFYRGTRERAAISARQSVLVAHQTPFRGDGSIEYDPVATTRQIRRAFGTRPLWAPISGVCRAQLACFAPLIRLTGEDWYNVFDTDAWVAGRAALSDDTITIGRHGRPDRLKWPATQASVSKTLYQSSPVSRISGAKQASWARQTPEIG